jgi:hypothetical protein
MNYTAVDELYSCDDTEDTGRRLLESSVENWNNFLQGVQIIVVPTAIFLAARNGFDLQIWHLNGTLEKTCYCLNRDVCNGWSHL